MATCQPCHSQQPTDLASGIHVGERHAGGRAEPDHRAAEADGVGEEAPVVAALLQAPARSAGCCRTRPRRSRARAPSATTRRAASRPASARRQVTSASRKMVPLKVSGITSQSGRRTRRRDEQRPPTRRAPITGQRIEQRRDSAGWRSRWPGSRRPGWRTRWRRGSIRLRARRHVLHDRRISLLLQGGRDAEDEDRRR